MTPIGLISIVKSMIMVQEKGTCVDTMSMFLSIMVEVMNNNSPEIKPIFSVKLYLTSSLATLFTTIVIDSMCY